MRHARLDDEVSFLVGDDDDLELHRLELVLSFMAENREEKEDEEEKMERDTAAARGKEGLGLGQGREGLR